MNKNKLILILLLAFSTQSLLAQNIYVPFRVGDKFGLSDTNGKLIVQPAYDFIWPEYRHSDYFAFSKVSEMKNSNPKKYFYSFGLIKNKKEIYSSPGHGVFNIKNDYIIAEIESFEEARSIEGPIVPNQQALLSLSGKDTYPQHFQKIRLLDRRSEGKNNSYLLFLAIGLDESANLIAYSSNEEKITQWLVKDIKELVIDKENDSYKIGGEKKRLYFDEGKFFLSPWERLPPVEDPAGRIPPYSRQRIAKDVAPDPKFHLADGTTERCEYSWNKSEERVYFKKHWIENGQNMNAMIETDVSAEDCEMHTFYRQKKEGTTRKSYSNFLISRSKNGKQGIQLTPELETKTIYDSILAISYADYSKKPEKLFYYFLVGQKDADGEMLFGTLDDKLEEALPIRYTFIGFQKRKEDLKYSSIKGRRTYAKKSIWMLEDKNQKMGFVHHTGAEITAIIYDSIEESGYNSSFHMFNMRKGDDNYGFIFHSDTVVLSPKKMDLELNDIVDDYADKKKYFVSLIERGGFGIFCMMDFKGNIFYRKE